MNIKKRSLPVYIILNCLTLGIYGFIVSCQVGKEIDALCRGDGERPKFSYAGAVLFRAIAPILGIVVGLITALINIENVGFALKYISGYGYALVAGQYKAVVIFSSMLTFGIIFTLFGTIITGIYLKYWWYKQASRLKLNGYRYDLKIKESGTDNFLLRTVLELLFIPITALFYVLTMVMPMFICWLINLSDSFGAYVFSLILVFLFVSIALIFGAELSTGAYFANGILFKNMNRYAKVYRNGARPFELMGYDYYPSVENKYPEFLPGIMNGCAPASAPVQDVVEPVISATGLIIGVNGSCAGYKFEINSGEEIVIGKDAKVSSVVIDPAYKEISRKHLSVCYEAIRDQYFVTDYSSNGTWANGSKLVTGQGVYLTRGTELKLANDKNIFRLG